MPREPRRNPRFWSTVTSCRTEFRRWPSLYALMDPHPFASCAKGWAFHVILLSIDGPSNVNHPRFPDLTS